MIYICIHVHKLSYKVYDNFIRKIAKKIPLLQFATRLSCIEVKLF